MQMIFCMATLVYGFLFTTIVDSFHCLRLKYLLILLLHILIFRWEDGNNLTSNLFTLINNTGLLQHTKKIHQTYMHTHINLTQKKKREEK